MTSIFSEKKKQFERMSAQINAALNIEELPREVQKLESQLYTCFSYIERLVEKRIVIELLNKTGKKLSENEINKLESCMRNIFNMLSFGNKFKLVRQFDDFRDIADGIEKLNRKRVFFAHGDRKEIIKEYFTNPNAQTNQKYLQNLIIATKSDVASCLNEYVPTIKINTIIDEEIPF